MNASAPYFLWLPALAVAAHLVGVGFHVWSAWNHKRRAVAQV